MNFVTKGFLCISVIFGVIGMLMGLGMAISEDHSQLPTHAHIMVIGWISFVAFGLFYHLFDKHVSPVMAKLHFWLATLSFTVLAISLWLIYSGNLDAGPFAAISATAYTVSFVLFAVIVFQLVRQTGTKDK